LHPSLAASARSSAVLTATGLAKSFTDEPLFAALDLTIGPAERAGIVGPNGAGKSTLLRILAGAETADAGRINRGTRSTLGYLQQQAPDPTVSIGDHLAAGLADVFAAETRMRQLERHLEHDASPAVLDAYAAAQEAWVSRSGWAAPAAIGEVREHLGIADVDPRTPLGEVSGGQQARVMLAGLLISRPDLLLLDEPTNHLDAAGIDWLGDYLAAFTGGVLVVSHDRAFLDRAVTRIVELDGIHAEPRFYTGGYTAYRAERHRRWVRLLSDFEAQQKAQLRLEEDIERTREQARGTELGTRNDKLRRYAKKVARKAKARERRLQRQMQSTQWIEQPTERPALALPLAGVSEPGAALARLDSVRLELGGRTVLSGVSGAVRGADRIVVTGPNGGGKTTLLRALAGDLAAADGTVTVTAATGYLPQVHDRLPLHRTPLAYLRSRLPLYEEDAEALLEAYQFDADAIRRPMSRLSAGELRRLLLAILINSGAELLLLDEPTNYLDFDAMDVLEEALGQFRGTLVTATHDRYFADRIGVTGTWRVADGKCR
jgi:ATPase subunit of ABC transporter with duplicated ATPase domains